MEYALSLCKYCSGEAKIVKERFTRFEPRPLIVCQDCGIKTREFDSVEEAVAFWNDNEYKPARKTQYHKDGETVKTYLLTSKRNPCGCGSNCYHLEYDGRQILGVCNACQQDVYEIKPEHMEGYLLEGVWKAHSEQKG